MEARLRGSKGTVEVVVVVAWGEEEEEGAVETFLEAGEVSLSLPPPPPPPSTL